MSAAARQFLGRLCGLEKRLLQNIAEIEAQVSTHMEIRVRAAAQLEFEAIDACTEVIAALEKAKASAFVEVDRIKVKKLLIQEQDALNHYALFRNRLIIKALS